MIEILLSGPSCCVIEKWDYPTELTKVIGPYSDDLFFNRVEVWGDKGLNGETLVDVRLLRAGDRIKVERFPNGVNFEWLHQRSDGSGSKLDWALDVAKPPRATAGFDCQWGEEFEVWR